MKSNFPVLLFTVGALLASLPVLPASQAPAARVIKIKAGVDNAMKFDVATITAAPGETITVSLTNACVLPKVIMGHNWVLLTAGTDPIAFATAAASEAGNGYIPEKQKDKVVAVVGLLGPNETGEVTFKVPATPGEYPFLCTFPAHCAIGMKGVLVVKN
ncbi:MAG: azurin [Opitutus sp.]|nr:azurin [Opitutus sp.]